MSQRIRIHALARELGLDNRTVLAACRKIGIAVRTHASTLSAEEADGVRRAVADEAAGREPESSPPADEAEPAEVAGKPPAADPLAAATGEPAEPDAIEVCDVAASSQPMPDAPPAQDIQACWEDGEDDALAPCVPASTGATDASIADEPFDDGPPPSTEGVFVPVAEDDDPIDDTELVESADEGADTGGVVPIELDEPDEPIEATDDSPLDPEVIQQKTGITAQRLRRRLVLGSRLKRLPLRVYTTAALLIGVVLASFFLFVQPKKSAMAEQREAIHDTGTSLQLLEVEMAKLASTQKQLGRLEEALERFQRGLPEAGEIDVILREVWVIADAAGLKTERIKTLKAGEQDGYSVLPIELNLRGRFDGLYRFLLSLERLPGAMKVQSLKIDSPPSSSTDGWVEAAVVLKLYCRK